MKLTKKQRGKIYLKVAVEFIEESNYDSLCHALLITAKIDWILGLMSEKACSEFPEFHLFAPSNKRLGYSWFTYNHERFTCMLLCYEMTKK